MRVPVVWVHANHDTICPKAMAYRWQDDKTCTYQPGQCWRCLRTDHQPRQALKNIVSLHVRRALFDGMVHVSASEIVRSRLMRPMVGQVIENSCELSLFRPLPEVSRDLNRILFVARLIPEKGAHILVSALARARRQGAGELRATIFGSGPEQKRLEKLAVAEGVEAHVDFRGSVARAHLPREIAGSLAVVNPQLWDWVLGISAIEALACGRPLISTRPANEKELSDDVALLFPRGDVGALAEALVRIRTDEALRRKLEAAGPAFAARSHAIDKIGAEYLQLIRETASLRPRNRLRA